MFPAPGIHSAESFCYGDIILIWNETFCVKAFALEIGDQS